MFCFETRNPSGHDLRNIDDEEHWDAFTNTAGQRVTVSGTQRYDTAHALMHWQTFRRWHDGMAERCHSTRIACKFTTLPQFDALLHRSGLHVAARYGDWNGSPLATRSEHIISICR